MVASFWMENYREKTEEKLILNESIVTIGNEVYKNIEYTKEHIF